MLRILRDTLVMLRLWFPTTRWSFICGSDSDCEITRTAHTQRTLPYTSISYSMADCRDNTIADKGLGSRHSRNTHSKHSSRISRSTHGCPCDTTTHNLALDVLVLGLDQSSVCSLECLSEWSLERLSDYLLVLRLDNSSACSLECLSDSSSDSSSECSLARWLDNSLVC